MKKIFAILDRLNHLFLDFVNYISSYGKAVKSAYKSNALAPIIWLDVFAIPVLLVLTTIFKTIVIKYILVGLVVLLIIFTLVMYVVLFKKDPKLLQSEGYRIEDKKLDLIAQKGGDIPINPVDLITSSEIGSDITHE